MHKLQQAIMLPFILLVLLCVSFQTTHAQGLPPAKYTGLVYGSDSRSLKQDVILIEAFLDPACTESKESWEPLVAVVQHYGHKVQLVVHIFPTPYHYSSHALSRALYIVSNNNKSSDTFLLLSKIFDHQKMFDNDHVKHINKIDMVQQVVDLTKKELGDYYNSTMVMGYIHKDSDLKARLSFKYSITRGVHTTPSFFINGFIAANAGSVIDYSGWRSLIDPLIIVNGGKV